MKNLTKLFIFTTLTLSLFGFSSQSNASTNNHLVKRGETLWRIANMYGISVTELKNINNKSNDSIKAGEKLLIPNKTVSIDDKQLMARLVSAEAKGEPYAGKVAVATVVLNRVDSKSFPNTIKEHSC